MHIGTTPIYSRCEFSLYMVLLNIAVFVYHSCRVVSGCPTIVWNVGEMTMSNTLGKFS